MSQKLLSLDEYRANIDEAFRALACDPRMREALRMIDRDLARELYALGFNDGSQWQADRDADMIEETDTINVKQ